MPWLDRRTQPAYGSKAGGNHGKYCHKQTGEERMHRRKAAAPTGEFIGASTTTKGDIMKTNRNTLWLFILALTLVSFQFLSTQAQAQSPTSPAEAAVIAMAPR